MIASTRIPHSAVPWGAFVAAKKGGRAQLVGPIDTPHQFVFVPDVGPIVCRLLATDGAWGHVWNFPAAVRPRNASW